MIEQWHRGTGSTTTQSNDGRVGFFPMGVMNLTFEFFEKLPFIDLHLYQLVKEKYEKNQKINKVTPLLETSIDY